MKKNSYFMCTFLSLVQVYLQENPLLLCNNIIVNYCIKIDFIVLIYSISLKKWHVALCGIIRPYILLFRSKKKFVFTSHYWYGHLSQIRFKRSVSHVFGVSDEVVEVNWVSAQDVSWEPHVGTLPRILPNHDKRSKRPASLRSSRRPSSGHLCESEKQRLAGNERCVTVTPSAAGSVWRPCLWVHRLWPVPRSKSRH